MEKESKFTMSRVSPQCIIRMLLHNCWMIVAAAICFYLAISLLLTWTYKPQYSANMTYAVTSQDSALGSGGSMTATKEVASMLSEMMTTQVIYEGIRGTDPRLISFNGSISASQIGNSNFIRVSVTADTPEQAFLALTTLTDVFPNVANFVSSNSVMTIMRNPTVSSYPTNPNNAASTAKLAAIAGAGLMAALLCYLHIQRGTVQTRTGAREMLDAPILASLNRERKNRTVKTALKRSTKHVQIFSPTISFLYADQVNAVCSHMEHENASHGRKIYMVTGVGESEGKSTVAGNVAAGLAMKGHRVVLLDCDLRKPSQIHFFEDEYQSELPLNKLLAEPFSRANLEKCLYHSEKLDLSMLFPIKSDARSAELLSGETMKQLLQALDGYDFVIVDTPPMGMFPDAEIIADLVDASMLVVRQDYVPACDINDNIDVLRKYKGHFLGVILNDMLVPRNRIYGYSKYGYGKYGYGGSAETETHSEHHHHHHTSTHDSDGKGGMA